jgi:uncharacterized membrane protein YedE/YeeE
VKIFKKFETEEKMIPLSSFHVDLLNPLVGGILMALGVAIVSWFLGRVMGMSGIINTALFCPLPNKSSSGADVKIPILLGMLFSSWLNAGSVKGSDAPGSFGWLLASGFLVGLGTTMANGCTSGHGLFGLARGSKRSIAAVVIFFSTAILVRGIVINQFIGGNGIENATLDITNVGWSFSKERLHESLNQVYIPLIIVLLTLALPFIRPLVGRSTIGLCAGMVFSHGLMISGMSNWKKVASFLELPWLYDANSIGGRVWPFHADPSLAIVFLSALIPNMILHPLLMYFRKFPLLDDKFYFQRGPGQKITFALCLGSILFGIGWGMSGICPGPAITILIPSILNSEYWCLSWWLGYISGAFSLILIST